MALNIETWIEVEVLYRSGVVIIDTKPSIEAASAYCANKAKEPDVVSATVIRTTQETIAVWGSGP